MEDTPLIQGARIESAMTAGKVILWWELRRILFNAILFVIGLAAVIGGLSLIDVVDPNRDVGTPLLGIVLYGFLANLFYTLGWIVELAGRQTDPASARLRGQRMFRAGMLFSCVLTTLPFWFGFGFWALNRTHSH
jgi:cytochrome bd-type quinol oxidase subunit 1